MHHMPTDLRTRSPVVAKAPGMTLNELVERKFFPENYGLSAQGT